VRKAFKEETLLPADDGSFVSAGQAKLAEADWLRNLLSEEQLRDFYGVDFRWITHDITERKTSDLWKYLKDRLSLEEIDSDKLAAKIRPSFLEKQTDEWIARFYTYLDNVESLWRKDPPGPLRAREFIRLEDGQHVNPFRNDGSPNCYLPPQGGTEFPVVKRNIVLDEGALKFLKALGLTEPDIVAEVIEKILPKYKITVASTISDREHSQDISKILRALKTDSQEKRERLAKSLIRTAFLRASNASTRETACKMPGEIYIQSAALGTYFNGNTDAWFLCESKGEDEWKKLGVAEKPRLIPFDPQFSSQERQKLRGNRGCTREKSTIDYILHGLDHFLEGFTDCKRGRSSTDRALILWNFLLAHLDSYHTYSKDSFFQGEHEWVYYCHYSCHFDAAWVKVLREVSWLPAPKNGPVNPGEISPEELPEEFRRDENLRKYLGMKSNEVAILAEKIGVEVDDIEFVKQYQKEFQDWKKVILQSSPAFPIRMSKDQGRREGKLNEDIENAPKKLYKELLRSVRITRGKIDPKTWLRNQYTNDRGQVICQICCNEMPFKKRDGEYYFEAVEVISDKRIEFEELYLALCPICAAKYKIFIKQEREEAEKVRRKIIEGELCEVPINLDKGNESIRFVEVHFNDLKIILDAKENDK
jgi:hypothetical protein